MGDREVVIGKIRGAFAGNEHPGGRFLQGSFEGCEPYKEVGPFEKVKDWRGIDAGFLDGHANIDLLRLRAVAPVRLHQGRSRRHSRLPGVQARSGPDVIDRQSINAALKSFWLERARTAPQARSLEQHIAEQQEYIAAISPGIEEGTGEK